MRLPRLVTTIACLSLLTACVSTDPSGRPRTIQVRQTELYTNAPSRFAFPPRVAGFERREVTYYDGIGQDIGVSYAHFDPRILVTAFVYPVFRQPPDDTLAGHFSTCKAQVLRAHSGAQTETEQGVEISPGGVQHGGRHAAFTYADMFAERLQPLRSELFLFTHGERFIKYRVTYPADQRERVQQAIRAFTSELAWP